jgi:hypothetical protein
MPRQTLPLFAALMAGLVAYVFVVRRVPRTQGRTTTSSIAMSFAKVRTRMYARQGREERLTRERRADVKKIRQRHSIDAPFPQREVRALSSKPGVADLEGASRTEAIAVDF